MHQPLPEELVVDFIPLASNTHSLAYSQYPTETIEINVMGADNALQKTANLVAMVLYPSTVEIYGNARGENVFTEEYTGLQNLSTARSCRVKARKCVSVRVSPTNMLQKQ